MGVAQVHNCTCCMLTSFPTHFLLNLCLRMRARMMRLSIKADRPGQPLGVCGEILQYWPSR